MISNSGLTPSINVEIADQVRELECHGHTIVKLQTGEPDFQTPAAITQVATKQLTLGENGYSSSSGINSLKRSIIEKLRNKNGYHTQMDRILVTHGAVNGIYLALSALLEAGDEVILLSPCWMPYISIVQMLGGIPVIVQTSKDNLFVPDVDSIKSAVNKKTKAIVVNSPNNPTGAIYGAETLRDIISVSVAHGIYILSDEVYEDIIYDKPHVSVQSLCLNYEKIISVFSLSKSYAMTGWRIGYVTASKDLIKRMNIHLQYCLTSLSPAFQQAAAFALSSDDMLLEVSKMKNEYQQRRDSAYRSFLECGGKEWVVKPSGAFYFFVEITKAQMNSIEFCKLALEQSKICFTPGKAFGADHDSYIRMTFATDQNSINQGVNYLCRVLK